MAITRTQIAKQLLANGGRIGFRGGDAARSDAASGRDAGKLVQEEVLKEVVAEIHLYNM